MSIFPSRPKIELYVPEPIFIGRACVFEFDVVAEDETKVEYIDIHVVGDQGWRISSGKSSIGNRHTFPELGQRVMQAGTLPAGTKQRFAASFTLPAATTPSHALRPAWASVEVQIRVAIPWWPDAKQSYFIEARKPPAADVVRMPSIGRSSTASSDDARIEVSLASTLLIAGEILVGSVAVYHMTDKKEREVEIQIVPQLILRSGARTRLRHADALIATVTLPPGSAGSAIPFQIQLPARMTPTFEGVTHDVSWKLVASTGSIFTGKTAVGMALTIIDRSAVATTPKLAEPPKIGDERMNAVLARFAVRRGWRQVPATADSPDIVIAGEHGKSELELAYAYRPKVGAFLVARVRHPSLGLGLVVAPSSTVRHLFFQDIEVDVAAWDRAHRVMARSAAQTVPFLKAMVPSLAKVGGLGRLVAWTDEELVFEREVTDLATGDLTNAHGLLQFITNELERERETIVPPAGLGADVEAWRTLAKELDGELAIGDLSIEGGRWKGVPVGLGLVFDEVGEPRELRIAAGSTANASAGLRELEWKLARPASDVLGASVPASVVDRITRWPSHVVDLRVKDGIAVITFQIDRPTAAFDDARGPETIGKLVASLVAVLGELAPETSPYR